MLRNLFTSDKSILATIGLKLTNSIKDFIINLPDVRLFQLSRQNFDEIYEKRIRKARKNFI